MSNSKNLLFALTVVLFSIFIPQSESMSCTATGQFCGQRDANGTSLKGALYHCSAIGAAGVLTINCPSDKCITVGDGGADHCAEESSDKICKCATTSGDICGQRISTLLLGNCTSGVLYHCSGAHLTARLKRNCPHNVCILSGPGGADYCGPDI